MTDSEWRDADIAARAADLAFRRQQQAENAQIATHSTDAQAARAVAEEHVAAAGQAAAAAHQAMAAAQQAMAAAHLLPVPPPTDSQRLYEYQIALLSGGANGGSVIALAQAQLAAWKAATYRPPSAPT